MEVSSTPVDGIMHFLIIFSAFAYLINCILGLALQDLISKDKWGKVFWGLSVFIFIIYPFALYKTMKKTKSIFARKKIDPIIDFGGCHLALWAFSFALASTLAIRFTTLDTYSENELNLLIFGLTAAAGLLTIGTLIGTIVLFSSRKKLQDYIAIRKMIKANNTRR